MLFLLNKLHYVKILYLRIYIVTDTVKFNDAHKLRKKKQFSNYSKSFFVKKMTLINNSAFLVFKVLFEIHYKKKVEKHLKPSGKIKLY